MNWLLISLLAIIVLSIIAVGVIATLPAPSNPTIAAGIVSIATSSTPTPDTTFVLPPAKPTPTLAAGQEIILPFNKKVDIKVVQASFPAPISKEIAIRALRYRQNAVDMWDLNKSTVSGKPITVTAVFGLVTDGKPGPNGFWSGSVNVGIENCQLEGECVLTGQVLDHMENRPMWVIDIEGINQPFAGGPSIINNHVVFGIDAQTLQRFNFGPYKS